MRVCDETRRIKGKLARGRRRALILVGRSQTIHYEKFAMLSFLSHRNQAESPPVLTILNAVYEMSTLL
jgi:hypothetical protein